MEYTENYYDLVHGTDEQSAKNIINNGFIASGDITSWCGVGVYFYDIKRKAWWAAKRKCRNVKDKNKLQPAIIWVDIENILKKDTLDFRVQKDLQKFQDFYDSFDIGNYKMTIDQVDNEFDRTIILRSLLISFYTKKFFCKLIIGHFKQRLQKHNKDAIRFSDSLDMVFGIETIYCVKDTNILSNIRLGGSKR